MEQTREKIKKKEVVRMTQRVCPDYPNKCHLCNANGGCNIKDACETLYDANYRDASKLADVIFDTLEKHITDGEGIDWEWWDNFKRQIKKGELKDGM